MNTKSFSSATLPKKTASTPEFIRLRDKLLRYISHRGRALTYGKSPKDKKFTAVASLQTKFSSLAFRNMDQLTIAVLNSENDLKSIAPGYKSEFYNKGVHADMKEIIEICRKHAKDNNLRGNAGISH